MQQALPIFDEQTCAIMEETIEPDYEPTQEDKFFFTIQQLKKRLTNTVFS